MRREDLSPHTEYSGAREKIRKTADILLVPLLKSHIGELYREVVLKRRGGSKT